MAIGGDIVRNQISLILELRKHTVDMTSNKYYLLPPTAFQLARLAKHCSPVNQEVGQVADNQFIARNLRRRLGPKIIGELVERYNAGDPTPALAREYGISTTGLRRLLLEEGVEFRWQSITPEDSNRAVKLYESGLTIREAVKEIGYSLGTIRRELHLRGVSMRPSGRWNHLPPKSKSWAYY